MTPPDLIEALLAFEGVERFDLDPACTERNIPAWRHIQYPEKDGLIESWGHPSKDHTLVFINPPYGDKLKLFMEKICFEIANGCRIWALTPSRTETRYQHEFGLTQANFTIFLKGRLKFLQNGQVKGTAPFPAMLLYYGDDWQEKAARWIESPALKGTLMLPVVDKGAIEAVKQIKLLKGA